MPDILYATMVQNRVDAALATLDGLDSLSALLAEDDSGIGVIIASLTSRLRSDLVGADMALMKLKKEVWNG